ncbi:hypothetical protein BIS10_17945, partial [Halomonas sp. 707B3]|nr:hypothetical protein [Halomonas sp. 707B3]
MLNDQKGNRVMRQQAKTIGIASLCSLTLLLAGCAGQSSAPARNDSRSAPTASSEEIAPAAPASNYQPVRTAQAEDWTPPLQASPEEDAA